MQAYTMAEIGEVLGISLEGLLEPGINDRNALLFSSPEDPGVINAFSREICRAVNDAGSILFVQQTGVWSSSENLYLVESFRRALGEVRSIHDAPVHVFTKDDVENCWTMFSLCLLNFWDFTLVSMNHQILVRGSHDEFVEVLTATTDELERFRTLVRQFDLPEIDPTQSTDNDIEDLTLQIADLLRSAGADPNNAALREDLARSLYEIVITGQEEQNSQFLQQLRSLAVAHPADAKTREYLARALYAVLYNSVQENNSSAVTTLCTELRRLILEHPDDGVIREIFAQGLAIAIKFAEEAHLERDLLSLRQEIELLAINHPDDHDVQTWARGIAQSKKPL